MLTIAVSGNAYIELDPELATATLAIELENKDREPIVKEAEQLHAELVAAAKAEVSAKTANSWTANQLNFGTFDKYLKNSDEAQKYHYARAQLTIEFTDFSALGKFLGAWSERAGVASNGINWQLKKETTKKVMRQIRIEAIKDALEKAAAYAEALGQGTPELVAVYEPGLRPSVSADHYPAGVAKFRQASFGIAMEASADSANFELLSEKIELTAEITADFQVAAK